MDSVKYIGMDVHKESISIAVMNGAGKIVMECVIETKASMILQQKSAAGVVLMQVRKAQTVRASSRTSNSRVHGASQSASAELYRFRRR